jgi:transposase
MRAMGKKYIVNLTVEERDALEALVKRARVSGLKRLRAQILLKADDGLTDQEIADELDVGVSTAERVRMRCVERGVEACLERRASERTSQVRKFDGASEARLAQIACSTPPHGRARWTIDLLSDKLVELKVFDSVSYSSVQRALKKTSSSPGL